MQIPIVYDERLNSLRSAETSLAFLKRYQGRIVTLCLSASLYMGQPVVAQFKKDLYQGTLSRRAVRAR
jgi:hypothetical protein